MIDELLARRAEAEEAEAGEYSSSLAGGGSSLLDDADSLVSEGDFPMSPMRGAAGAAPLSPLRGAGGAVLRRGGDLKVPAGLDAGSSGHLSVASSGASSGMLAVCVRACV